MTNQEHSQSLRAEWGRTEKKKDGIRDPKQQVVAQTEWSSAKRKAQTFEKWLRENPDKLDAEYIYDPIRDI
jgi:hypothetical protein